MTKLAFFGVMALAAVGCVGDKGECSRCTGDECATAKVGRTVLFLGDSITDVRHIGCQKNYWGYLSERYGFHPNVYGINGQQMSHILAQAEKYRKEHPEAPDVIFIFAGTNDFNGNVPLGEWYEYSEEKTNRNGREVVLKKRKHVVDDTFRGRINRTMIGLREMYPIARIVLLTPIHRGFAKFGEKNVQPDETYANELGLFVDEYVKAVIEAGNVWSATVIDLNSESGIYPNAKGQDKFIHRADTDRLHPSNMGHERIAEAIARRVGDMLGE